MSFSAEEFMLGRQRCQQWVPLITQQFRLRHVYQIIGLNLPTETIGSFYFTLHSTTMSAPFYTSEQVSGSNPKWEELILKDMLTTSASSVVLRIWQHSTDGADLIVLTWGVHFSGLCYIGNKMTDIQPVYFKRNSVIFCMQGGFYTSHHVVNTDFKKPIPFLSNLNLIDTSNDKVIYRRIAIKTNRHEVQNSYNEEKLRRLHRLQVEIRNKSIDVHNLQDKISRLNGYSIQRDGTAVESVSNTGLAVRYAPQLLTMNSLYKMLQEKPTVVQKQEMVKIAKEIETAKFRTRLLSQEKDKKTVMIRSLRQKYTTMVEENEERNSDLMENYHNLSRGVEKFKEYKKNLFHHRELYSNFNLQLQQRRKQLLRELLSIYPIEKIENDNFNIFGVHLPNSDILADCSDTGLAVALGYVAHILIMCSTFLQVPPRYSITHYGSRSVITDHVSPLLPDKDRDFPLYTRGKDKAHFTYAVYLLNKNLAQFRWLLYNMTTTDLRQTLCNLLTFLQGPREAPLPAADWSKTALNRDAKLHLFSSAVNLADPILDFIRQECQQQPQQRCGSSSRNGSKSKSSEGGKGLGEILAIPEAYLNRRISSDSFRSFANGGLRHQGTDSCSGLLASSLVCSQGTDLIKITNGKEIDQSRDAYLLRSHSIEQGTDALNSPTKFSPVIAKSIEAHSEVRAGNLTGDVDRKEDCDSRMGRSVGSPSGEEKDSAPFSEPALSVDSQKKEEDPQKKEEDPQKKEEDPQKKEEDPQKKEEDPQKKEEDPQKKEEDPQKKEEDPQKKEEGPQKKEEDPANLAPAAPQHRLSADLHAEEDETVLVARANALRTTKSFKLMRSRP